MWGHTDKDVVEQAALKVMKIEIKKTVMNEKEKLAE